MFEIEYDLTREDYIEYNMHHMSISKTMKRTLFIQQYIISLMFIVAPFFLVMITKAPFKFWLTVFVITYLLWIIFYPKYFKLVVKRRINKMLDEGKQENILVNIVNLANFFIKVNSKIKPVFIKYTGFQFLV